MLDPVPQATTSKEALILFVNHLLIHLTCKMLFDILLRTSRSHHHPSNAKHEINNKYSQSPTPVREKNHLLSNPTEPWLSRLAFREIKGVFVQKTPSIGSPGADVEAGNIATPQKSKKEDACANALWKQSTPVKERDAGKNSCMSSIGE